MTRQRANDYTWAVVTGIILCCVHPAIGLSVGLGAFLSAKIKHDAFETIFKGLG